MNRHAQQRPSLESACLTSGPGYTDSMLLKLEPPSWDSTHATGAAKLHGRWVTNIVMGLCLPNGAQSEVTGDPQ